MEAVQKDHWYFMVLFIFLPLLKVSVQQKLGPVTVHLEEGMVLECLCPWDGNLSMVSWTKVPDKSPIAIFHPELGVTFSYRYHNRVEFLRSNPMDGSVAMRNITHQDIGVYHCSVHTFPRGSWSRDVQVEDPDEALELEDDDDDITDDITGDPTPEAEADTEVVAQRNHNLTIRCTHRHNETLYRAVVVERLAQGHHVWAPLGRCWVEDGNLEHEELSPRAGVSCSLRLDVSLRLSAVTEDDAGFYRCRFSTNAGTHSTTVLLTVHGRGEFSLSQYMIYIYTASGAAVLVLLIVFLVLTVRHRRRNKREEYRVKLHPAPRKPNFYGNVFVHERAAMRNDPVYTNVHTHKTRKASAAP